MENKKTNFLFGFNDMGKRVNQVGEDLVGTYIAPEGWAMPTYEGTPVNFDTTNPGDLKKTADGEEPDALLFERVNDKLTDLAWATGALQVDETPAGNPVSVMLFKKNAIIETELLHDTNTPTAGDDIYVEGNMYSNTDPTAGSGTIVGKCLEINNGVAKIILK